MPVLSRLGDAGWELLVDALADRRLPVVQAACEQLERSYEAWQRQPDPAAQRAAQCVLERLVLRANALTDESYPTVQRLAQGLLRLRTDPAAVDELAWIEHCEKLLLFVQHQQHAVQLAPLAGRSSEPPSDAIAISQDPIADEQEDAPTPPPLAIVPLGSPPPAGQPLATQPPRADLAEAPVAAEPPAPGPPMDAQTGAPAEETVEAEQLRGMSDKELIEWLGSDRAQRVVSAAEELERRGHSPALITMAEHLLDRSADVRLAMAQQLPPLPPEQLRPWLLRLSEDEDLRVRRVAVSHMAASADPVLRRRLRELEATETDAVILRRIEQAHVREALRERPLSR